MNTHLYRTIFNQMSASLSIKESEELTENIMGAIQKETGKEVKESADTILRRRKIPVKDNLVRAMEEYALQYQSVPVSEWISVKDRFPDEGKLVELATEHGKMGMPLALKYIK